MEIINTTVVYPIVGYDAPKDWCDIVLGFYEDEGDILEYKFLDAAGLDVTFSFKQEVPSEISVAELIVSVYDFLNAMLAEPDFVVKDISILSPDRDESFEVHANGQSVA